MKIIKRKQIGDITIFRLYKIIGGIILYIECETDGESIIIKEVLPLKKGQDDILIKYCLENGKSYNNFMDDISLIVKESKEIILTTLK